MSQQAFFMCMAQYIDLWQEPMQELVQDVHSVALDVSVKLAEILFVQYPGLREGIKGVTERALAAMAEETSEKLRTILTKEKDPFTLNMFLPQWVNKLRFDRFKKAVEGVFEESNNPNYFTAKEDIYTGEGYAVSFSPSPLFCLFYKFHFIVVLSRYSGLVQDHTRRVPTSQCHRHG